MYLISDGGVNSNTLDTIEAIMLTKNINYLDGVKLDVRKSLDNIFVLSRYDDLSKLTFSKNKVSQSNYDYLKKVKFPSHIFKYYIPTLEEVLQNYNKNKIIVLELYEKDNFDNLYRLLLKYHYNYFFMSKENEVLERLVYYHFDNLGKIINKESNIEIISSVTHHDMYDNTLLIIEK